MGFGRISTECLVIELYGMFSMLLLSGHAWRRFSITSGTFWHQTFLFFTFLFESQYVNSDFANKKIGGKNDPFKKYYILKSWP